jgi:hypothetical protein
MYKVGNEHQLLFAVMAFVNSLVFRLVVNHIKVNIRL